MPFSAQKKNVELLSFYLEKATNFVDSQINLLKLSLKYPNTFDRQGGKNVVSPFKWAKSKNDLIEIISGLAETAAVINQNGENVAYIELVKGFELFFNVKISNPYNKREEVMNRKIRTVNFLKQMMNAIIAKSQK